MVKESSLKFSKEDIINMSKSINHCINDFFIKCECTDELTSLAVETFYKITYENIFELRNNSSLGWGSDAKGQFYDPQNLIIFIELESRIAGFALFSYEVYYDCPVFYCLELQVSKDFQRMGVGRFLIEHLRLLGTMCNINRIVLTVLKENRSAKLFYKTMGFEIDISCPSHDNVSEDYEIICLSLDIQKFDTK